MSDFKSVMKGGWHPKGKDGGKESWRGDFKGINQVAGWMGKGRTPGDKDREEHVSRPLASLKDPSSFGPPPKNVNYHGGAALPNEITPHRGGIGAPLTQAQIDNARKEVQGPTQEEIEEQEKRKGPPVPYRADRTGLQTTQFAPPPVHRDVAASPTAELEAPKPKPGLPPRLPARRTTEELPAAVSPPPPAYEAVAKPVQTPIQSQGIINQSAVNRLGNAGVSVPGLGIGRNNNTDTSNPWSSEQSKGATSPPTSTGSNTLSELSSRFARMNSSSGNNNNPPSNNTQPVASPTPPTLAQSKSAMRTASQLQSDPSKVTMADAQSAATTAQSGVRSANAFREKHADTFAAAGRRANAFDQKYKVKSRFESFLDKHAPLEDDPNNPNQQQQQPVPQLQQQSQTQQQQQQQQQQQVIPPPQASPELAASISRKPPPPPPPKKPRGMHGNNVTGGGGAVSPPPVPMGTKPGYQ